MDSAERAIREELKSWSISKAWATASSPLGNGPVPQSELFEHLFTIQKPVHLAVDGHDTEQLSPNIHLQQVDPEQRKACFLIGRHQKSRMFSLRYPHSYPEHKSGHFEFSCDDNIMQLELELRLHKEELTIGEVFSHISDAYYAQFDRPTLDVPPILATPSLPLSPPSLPSSSSSLPPPPPPSPSLPPPPLSSSLPPPPPMVGHNIAKKNKIWAPVQIPLPPPPPPAPSLASSRVVARKETAIWRRDVSDFNSNEKTKAVLQEVLDILASTSTTFHAQCLAQNVCWWHVRRIASGHPMMVEVRFTRDYPREMPWVRLISQRAQYPGSRVCIHGNMYLDKSVWNGGDDADNGATTTALAITKFMDSVFEYVSTNVKLYPVEASVAQYDHELAFKAAVEMRKRPNTHTTQNKFDMREIKVYSVEHAKTNFKDLNFLTIGKGDKILLPPSAAQTIFSSPRFSLPLMFEIQTKYSMHIYCGLQEFSAPDSTAIIPNWIMQSLHLQEGDTVRIRSVKLEKGTQCKLQPQSKEFYKLKNHKVILEESLRFFTTLTEGSAVPVRAANKIYWMNVLETKPKSAISIVAEPYLDLKTEFAAALDFQQDDSQILEQESATQMDTKQQNNNVPAIALEGQIVCENCQQPVQQERYWIHLPHCKKLFTWCEQCKSKVCNKEIHAHNIQITCEQCHIHRCKSCEMRCHMDFSCTERIIYCQYCAIPVTASAANEHEEHCGSTTRLCEICSNYYLLKYQLEHFTNCTGVHSPNVQQHQSQVKQHEKQLPYSSFVGFQTEFTCPYPECQFPGLRASDLVLHVESCHKNDETAVVCPICANLPHGDPNKKSQDFKGHLTARHKGSGSVTRKQAKEQGNTVNQQEAKEDGNELDFGLFE